MSDATRLDLLGRMSDAVTGSNMLDLMTVCAVMLRASIDAITTKERITPPSEIVALRQTLTVFLTMAGAAHINGDAAVGRLQ